MALDLNDIIEKLGTLLDAATALPLVWENKSSEEPAPYITFASFPVGRQEPSLSGTGKQRQTGYALITVVVPPNTFATAAITHAEDIAAAFPSGGRFTTPTSIISILDPPSILPGFPDGLNWRQPVRVPYLAIAS